VNPFHRAILKNYFRHLLLEISGYWDQILVPELTIDEPVYPNRAPRKNDRAHRPRRGGKLLPHHLRNGQERHGCTADVHVRRRLRGCHGSPVAEVLTDILARNEQGVTEADPNAHYLLTHNIFQIFSYTRAAKLVGDAPPTTRPATTTRNSIPRTSLLPEDAGRELAPLLDRATAMHKADTWHASPIIAG